MFTIELYNHSWILLLLLRYFFFSEWNHRPNHNSTILITITWQLNVMAHNVQSIWNNYAKQNWADSIFAQSTSILFQFFIIFLYVFCVSLLQCNFHSRHVNYTTKALFCLRYECQLVRQKTIYFELEINSPFLS